MEIMDQENKKACNVVPYNDGGFQVGSLIVYPSRGVFRLTDLKNLEIDGDTVTCLILKGEHAQSVLTVPLDKAQKGAVRPLSSPATLRQALDVLTQRRRQSRAPWIRRAQGFEAKIKTGDPILLAEVLRDLRWDNDQSFSERQVVDRALGRLAAELAAAMGVQDTEAREQIMNALNRRAGSGGSAV